MNEKASNSHLGRMLVPKQLSCRRRLQTATNADTNTGTAALTGKAKLNC